MKAVIIEDEARAAHGLLMLLKQVAPQVEVVQTLASVQEAIEWFSTHEPPDLAFMDIHLADGLSFDILDAVRLECPVIFTTAHDQYALRAFEVHGVDYLLKPIGPQRLAAALTKLRHVRLPTTEAAAQLYRSSSRQYKQRFLVRGGTRLVSVDVGRIAYFVKELVVRMVTMDGRGYPMSQSLDELQQQLDPAAFFRVNRQVLAHMQSVRDIVRASRGRLQLVLEPPMAEAPIVSQDRASAFKRWLDA